MQSDIEKFIIQFTKENGVAPTFREVGKAVGLKSSATVAARLERLKANGRITYLPKKQRTLRVLTQ